MKERKKENEKNKLNLLSLKNDENREKNRKGKSFPWVKRSKEIEERETKMKIRIKSEKKIHVQTFVCFCLRRQARRRGFPQQNNYRKKEFIKGVKKERKYDKER